MENLKKIVNFFFEVASSKRVPRSGLPIVDERNSDSVAEHGFVAAQIAYLLAKMEKANAEHAVLVTLFHDNGETRLGDMNLIQKCYLDTGLAEKKAFFDQVEGLIGEDDLKGFFEEFDKGETLEAVIAWDADKLELAVQAKCSLDMGSNKSVHLWIDRIRALLRTNSAQKLLVIIEETDMNEWWQEIPEIQKEIKRIKKD